MWRWTTGAGGGGIVGVAGIAVSVGGTGVADGAAVAVGCPVAEGSGDAVGDIVTVAVSATVDVTAPVGSGVGVIVATIGEAVGVDVLRTGEAAAAGPISASRGLPTAGTPTPIWMSTAYQPAEATRTADSSASTSHGSRRGRQRTPGWRPRRLRRDLWSATLRAGLGSIQGSE